MCLRSRGGPSGPKDLKSWLEKRGWETGTTVRGRECVEERRSYVKSLVRSGLVRRGTPVEGLTFR